MRKNFTEKRFLMSPGIILDNSDDGLADGSMKQKEQKNSIKLMIGFRRLHDWIRCLNERVSAGKGANLRKV